MDKPDEFPVWSQVFFILKYSCLCCGGCVVKSSKAGDITKPTFPLSCGATQLCTTALVLHTLSQCCCPFGGAPPIAGRKLERKLHQSILILTCMGSKAISVFLDGFLFVFVHIISKSGTCCGQMESHETQKGSNSNYSLPPPCLLNSYVSRGVQWSLGKGRERQFQSFYQCNVGFSLEEYSIPEFF